MCLPFIICLVCLFPFVGDEGYIVKKVQNHDRARRIYPSSKQLRSLITQGNWPLAIFSTKLSAAQQKYSMTELKLLAIVETHKEFKGMLCGQRLMVYTDHKNLIQDQDALGFTSDHDYQ